MSVLDVVLPWVMVALVVLGAHSILKYIYGRRWVVRVKRASVVQLRVHIVASPQYWSYWVSWYNVYKLVACIVKRHGNKISRIVQHEFSSAGDNGERLLDLVVSEQGLTVWPPAEIRTGQIMQVAFPTGKASE